MTKNCCVCITFVVIWASYIKLRRFNKLQVEKQRKSYERRAADFQKIIRSAQKGRRLVLETSCPKETTVRTSRTCVYLTTYAIYIDRNIILELLTACYACGRINIPATRHLDSHSNTIGYIDKSFGELFRVNVLPRVVYAQNTVRPHVLVDYD